MTREFRAKFKLEDRVALYFSPAHVLRDCIVKSIEFTDSKVYYGVLVPVDVTGREDVLCVTDEGRKGFEYIHDIKSEYVVPNDYNPLGLELGTLQTLAHALSKAKEFEEACAKMDKTSRDLIDTEEENLLDSWDKN